jgi:hypothetical protein
MFETAVIGPFAPRLGVVRQCIDCRARLGPDAPECPGFGPGCHLSPGEPASLLPDSSTRIRR